jgi:polyphosphate kinase
VTFPVRNALIRERIMHEILDAYLADNVKARLLARDGHYAHVRSRSGRGGSSASRFSAQDFLIGVAEGKLTTENIPARLPTPVKTRRSRARGRISQS